MLAGFLLNLVFSYCQINTSLMETSQKKANLHALQKLIYEDCYYTLLPFLRVKG